MFHVIDIDNHIDDRLAVGSAGLDIANVGVVVADYGRKLFQHARTIVAKNRQLYWIFGAAFGGVLLGWFRPFYGDPPIGFIHQVGNVGAAYRMDRDAFAAGHVSDNLFSANGIAATRAINQ